MASSCHSITTRSCLAAVSIPLLTHNIPLPMLPARSPAPHTLSYGTASAWTWQLSSWDNVLKQFQWQLPEEWEIITQLSVAGVGWLALILFAPDKCSIFAGKEASISSLVQQFPKTLPWFLFSLWCLFVSLGCGLVSASLVYALVCVCRSE